MKDKLCRMLSQNVCPCEDCPLHLMHKQCSLTLEFVKKVFMNSFEDFKSQFLFIAFSIGFAILSMIPNAFESLKISPITWNELSLNEITVKFNLFALILFGFLEKFPKCKFATPYFDSAYSTLLFMIYFTLPYLTIRGHCDMQFLMRAIAALLIMSALKIKTAGS